MHWTCNIALCFVLSLEMCSPAFLYLSLFVPVFLASTALFPLLGEKTKSGYQSVDKNYLLLPASSRPIGTASEFSRSCFLERLPKQKVHNLRGNSEIASSY